jgi:hypothetical protein
MATSKPEPNKTTDPPAQVDLPKGFTKLDDDFGDVWNPEKIGEQLKGIFLGIAYVPSKRANRGPFITHRIKTDNGVRSVASAILQRRMERIPDDTPVVLVYQGKLETGQGDSNNFDVYYPESTQLKAVKPPDLGDEYIRR